MDIPLYGRALWTYKWLLLAGIVVAVLASLMSGYRLEGSKLTSRAVESYTSSTTVLLSNGQTSLFQAKAPGEAIEQGQSAPQRRDLSATAILYAYLISGDVIRSATEDAVGTFASDEAVTAVQRTTQPPTSELTPGRFNLPVVSVIGTAATAERAEQISRAATEAFESYVSQQQDSAQVPADQRVSLNTLNIGSAERVDTGNPLIGVVVVGAGTLAIFIALIFVLYNARMRRAADEQGGAAGDARQHEVLEHEDGDGTRVKVRHAADDDRSNGSSESVVPLSEPAPGGGTALLTRSDEAAPAAAGGATKRSRRSSAPRVYTLRVVLSGLLLAAVCLAAAAYLPTPVVGGVLAMVAIATIGRRALTSWTGLLVVLVAIILFVPVRRFKLPIPLPFALEPYRAIIVVLTLAVIISLLVDPRFSWRRTGFGSVIGILLAGMTLSVATNVESLANQGLLSSAVGALVNYGVLFGIFFLVRVLLVSERRVQLLVNLLALGGAFIGAAAAVERLLRFNIFLRLGSLAQLQRIADETEILRGGGARAFGSAQHPIALSVLLAMLMPLAVYQAKHSAWPSGAVRRQFFWVGCAMLMGVGIICSVSRTSLVVLSAIAVVAVLARPALFKRLVLIGVPAAAVASLVAPGVVLSLLRSFLNPSALIASQYVAAGWRGSGRLADLGPNLQAAMVHPFFGTGVGSRIVVGPAANALILDDQMLNTLLETGFVGIICVVLLVWYPVVRLWIFSRSPSTPARLTDLAVALLSAMVGYFVSLFFFDGFGFLQTVMVFAILLAIGGWLITEVPASRRPRRAAPWPIYVAARRTPAATSTPAPATSGPPPAVT